MERSSHGLHITCKQKSVIMRRKASREKSKGTVKRSRVVRTRCNDMYTWKWRFHSRTHNFHAKYATKILPKPKSQIQDPSISLLYFCHLKNDNKYPQISCIWKFIEDLCVRATHHKKITYPSGSKWVNTLLYIHTVCALPFTNKLEWSIDVTVTAGSNKNDDALGKGPDEKDELEYYSINIQFLKIKCVPNGRSYTRDILAPLGTWQMPSSDDK